MSADTKALPACRQFILDALGREMRNRQGREFDTWVIAERVAVTVAANRWALSEGMDRRVTVDDVERVEQMAVGHVDYARKLALYVAELLYRPGEAAQP